MPLSRVRKAALRAAERSAPTSDSNPLAPDYSRALSSTRHVRCENPLPQADNTSLRRLVGSSVGPGTPHADFWRLRDVLSSDACAACSKGFLREHASSTAPYAFSACRPAPFVWSAADLAIAQESR